MITRVAAIGLMLAFPGAANACSALGSAAAETPRAKRPIEAADLARIVDIGREPYDDGSAGLSVSPDGRRVAFQLRRADPDANSYCQSIVVLDLDGRRAPVEVDTGGEPIHMEASVWGLAGSSGVDDVIRPLWSPDGSRLAFRKREGGHTRAWIADADGSHSGAVGAEGEDVTALAWRGDGKALEVTSYAVSDLEAQRDLEGLEGFHLDDRFAPVNSSRPSFRGPLPVVTGIVEVPTAAAADPAVGTSALQPAAWQKIDREEAGRVPAIAAMKVAYPVVAAFRSRDGSRIAFLRREGAGGASLGLYLWKSGQAAPVRKFATKGVILGCEPAATLLICAREEAAQPRIIVKVDPLSGRTEPIFDPNPAFASFDIGKVQRLTWTNARGIETFGDLVLPPGHRPGQKHPLIVVTYVSKGFLRGGTGDEFPIFPLAAKGFAVLSFNRPMHISETVETRSVEEGALLNRKDFADRRSVQSSLEEGIAVVDKLGVLDRSRMGIAGLSEGTSIVLHALINSDLFHAASASSCCVDPGSSMALLGQQGAGYFERTGFPSPADAGDAFWSVLSVARNAGRLSTPMLMQLADAEYRYALEGLRALRFYKQPVDAYVFPDEDHVKSQPAHRLAIYSRNIDWFRFWLMDQEPADEVEAERWKLLRTGRKP